MSNVIAQEPKRLSDLVKYELLSKYTRKSIHVETGTAFTLEFGAVLGTANGEDYVPCVESASNGTEVPAAIFIGTHSDGVYGGGDFGVDVEVPEEGIEVVALVRGPAIVGADALVLGASYDNATKVAQMWADIETNMHIVVGEQD